MLLLFRFLIAILTSRFRPVNKSDGALAATGLMRTLLRGPNGNVPPRDLLALLGMEDTPSPEVPK